MNNKEKFENFLESLKGNGQDVLIESVKQGFEVCFESSEKEQANALYKELVSEYGRSQVDDTVKKMPKKVGSWNKVAFLNEVKRAIDSGDIDGYIEKELEIGKEVKERSKRSVKEQLQDLSEEYGEDEVKEILGKIGKKRFLQNKDEYLRKIRHALDMN